MVSEGKYIVASGPVIIENGKLLVIKDSKDGFYKIPGGTVEEQDKNDLEKTCKREFKEETNGEIGIIEKLSTMILDKNPKTGEKMKIELHHYRAKLKNKKDIKPLPPVQEIRWLDINEIKQEKYIVAPNINFLIERGEIGNIK
ncbi:MAG: NUDIX hydrolase [Nanoarchaeota archaeon]